jgi:tRNA (guanine26-N2/guanine27-N2)-dimethyltransferase
LIEDWQQEGKARFRVGPAFYRPNSELTRNLGILGATVLRQHLGGLTVLDAMTGCGVRSLRYVLESGADFVWANDGNCDLEPIIRRNLDANIPSHCYRLTTLPLQRLLALNLFQGDRFDWVDLDCFGSPGASLSMAIAATRIGGCLYLTATDGKSLSGQDSSAALRQFNAYTRHHPAVHEQGVRVLTGFAVQQARQQGLDLKPLFSFFCGQTYRVLLRLLPKAPATESNYGFLGYCHHCGQSQPVRWRSLNGAQCNNHPAVRPLILSGPMWLGPLHDSDFLVEMLTLAIAWQWQQSAHQLQLMQTEIPLPPGYIPLAEIGKRGQMDIPPRQLLIDALQTQAFHACRSSILTQAIYTDAPMPKVIAIARCLKAENLK